MSILMNLWHGAVRQVGLLAATEGREILASLTTPGPTPGDGTVVTTPR